MEEFRQNWVKRRLNLDSTAAASPKKAKVVGGGGASGVKNTTLFKKKFSNEDEIVLLKKFINFKSKTGSDDQIKFLEATKGKLTLSFPASQTQLYEKIRRFKDRYVSQVAKGKTDFSDPHVDKIYRLSHKAFGFDDGQKNDDETVDEANNENADCWTLYPNLCQSIESEARPHLHVIACNVKEYVKMSILKLGEEKAKELEEEWFDLTVVQIELFAKRVQVLSEQTKAVASVLKKLKLID